MKLGRKSVAAFAILVASGYAFAADDAAKQEADSLAKGQELSSTVCAACHGEQGIGKSELWPNLAGQKKAYLVKQLQNFKDGTRPDPVMSPIATMLSKDDMQSLAAYFASLTP